MKRIRSFSILSLALALVGCDAMTAHTDVVARVGSYDLTQDETVELLAGNPSIPARAEVVEQVANLWVDYMALAMVLSEDTTLAELEMAPLVDPYVEQQTFMQLRSELMTADTVISDEELRAAFAEQAPGLRIRARHVLLTYPEEADDAARDSVAALAREIQQRAAAGEDFAALAEEYSQDPGSAQSGGDLGWFQRGRMVKPFEDVAFALEPGEVSGVVETPFGLHIIKVEERETPEWTEATGEQFRRQLIQERQQESVAAYVDSLREAVGLELQEGAVDIAKELASEPGKRLSTRAAQRELATWDGGSLMARDLVQALRRFPAPQQAQFASAPDDQLESVIRDLATNQLVLADARARGMDVPQEEQDSIRGLMVEQVNEISRQVNLVGEPQEGETEQEAIDRRVRAFLEGVLSGEQQMLPLGPLSFVLRDQVEWQINDAAYPQVLEELEARRASQPPAQPMPQAQPQAPQDTQPPAEDEGAGSGVDADTTG